MKTLTYRYTTGDRIAYVGARKRLRGKLGRIDGPHIPSAPQLARMEELGIRRRESYEITWDDGTQETVLAGCLRRPTERRPILELQEGDIVANHGMRILIDGPMRTNGKEFGYSDDNPAYVWPGLVINADDLCDPASRDYDNYIACHLRGTWWQDRGGKPEDRDRWNIQGSYSTQWYVEMR